MNSAVLHRVKKLRLVAALVATISLVAGPPAGATDNEKIWYVNAARPDDTGDGHTPATAKKTMTAALAASAEGDTFYISPGIYSSTSSLLPKSGQTWIGSGWATVIRKTTGGFNAGAIKLANVSSVTIENLKSENTATGGQGLNSFGCDACTLRRVWADGSLDGARLDSFHNGLIDQCSATSAYDAWVINGRCTIVKNTSGETTGTSTGDPMCCFRTGLNATEVRDVQISYVNCQAFSSRTGVNASPIKGWEINGSCVVLLESSSASVRSIATGSAEMRGISAKQNGVCLLSANAVSRTENQGTGGASDLRRVDSAVLEADPRTAQFITTTGTVTVRLPNFPPGSAGGLTVVP